jgi:4-alpha-glucanotransferase
LGALQEQGLKPAQPATPFDAFTAELAHALHLYLARSATALAALQLEDLLGETLPVNVPGTDREYPNWQRKVSAHIEDLAARVDLATYFAEISQARLS